MINSNTNKTNVEELIAQETNARTSADNALSSRISTLEGKHIYQHYIRILTTYYGGSTLGGLCTILTNDASQFTPYSLNQWLRSHGFIDTQGTTEGRVQKAIPATGSGSNAYFSSISADGSSSTKLRFYYGAYGGQGTQAVEVSQLIVADTVIQLL